MEPKSRAQTILACATGMQASMAQLVTIRQNINKAAVSVLLATPLSVALSFPDEVRADIPRIIDDVMKPADAAKLSKLWEPSRSIDKENKALLKRDLVDLFLGRRKAYTKPSYPSPQVAQTLPPDERAALRAAIERLSPTADLKALLKKWDPKGKAAPTTRNDAKQRLLRHLEPGPAASTTEDGRRNARPQAASVA